MKQSEEQARDRLKQELKVGATVVFNPPGYSGLRIGKIVKLTPKGATIAYGKSKCNRFAGDIVLIDEQLRHSMKTNPELFI